MEVSAGAYVVDNEGNEVASVAVTTNLPIALNILEEFFRAHSNLNVTKGAYWIEYNHTVIRQSHLEPVQNIVVYASYL